jgi:hypothetical protein
MSYSVPIILNVSVSVFQDMFNVNVCIDRLNKADCLIPLPHLGVSGPHITR